MKFYLLCCSLALALTSGAPVRTITGRVTSMEDGAPLPGVNIIVKGTSVGTTTDVNRSYTISADSGATLVISFIGYVRRKSRLILNLQLILLSKQK